MSVETQRSVDMQPADTARLPLGRGLHELACRAGGGLEIRLYWDADEDSTHVEVWQPDSGELLLFEVANERALEAFYHPFAEMPLSLEVVAEGDDS